MTRKTHKVIDETYHCDEMGHDVMVGTVQECNDFVAEQDTIGYQVLPMTKEEIEAYPDNQAPKLPADFTEYPWSSILQNSESEVIACNIMKILKRTGNTWRELTWDEYRSERIKDGSTASEGEKEYFEKVIGYCKSADTAVLFSKTWTDVYTLQ